MSSGASQEALCQAMESFIEGMRYYAGFGNKTRNDLADNVAYDWFRDSFKHADVALKFLLSESADNAAIERAHQLYCNAVLMAYKSLLRCAPNDFTSMMMRRSLKKSLGAQNWKMWSEEHAPTLAWERLTWISSPLRPSRKRERNLVDDTHSRKLYDQYRQERHDHCKPSSS